MAVNEQIVTGRKFRKLIDEATKLWQRISFWTKSSDVEFDDGKNAETKVGAIDGITDSLVSTSSNIAASAKAVSTLNNNLNNLAVEYALLATCDSATYVTYTITNITSFRFILLNRGIILSNPALIPVGLFKAIGSFSTRNYVENEGLTYGGEVYYINDTSIKMKRFYPSSDPIKLYGIK